MTQYHKIQTVWERDPETKFKTLIEGSWATPEFAYLRDCDWFWTEKVDGTNIRLIWDGERVQFGGKTDNAQIPAHLINHLQERFTDFSNVFGCPAVVYGEGFGEKIQKGGDLYGPVNFVVFDVRVGDWWLNDTGVLDVAENIGAQTVPLVGVGPLEEAIDIARQGFVSQLKEDTAEGLVLRPVVPLFARDGSRVIAKVKHKDFK